MNYQHTPKDRGFREDLGSEAGTKVQLTAVYLCCLQFLSRHFKDKQRWVTQLHATLSAQLPVSLNL